MGAPIMSLSNRRHGISGGGLADSGEGYLEFWQAEMDLPEKTAGSSMVLTNGGFTVLVKRWLSTGKTRDQQTFKSCALAGIWTGRWGLQETIFRAEQAHILAAL